MIEHRDGRLRRRSLRARASAGASADAAPRAAPLCAASCATGKLAAASVAMPTAIADDCENIARMGPSRMAQRANRGNAVDPREVPARRYRDRHGRVQREKTMDDLDLAARAQDFQRHISSCRRIFRSTLARRAADCAASPRRGTPAAADCADGFRWCRGSNSSPSEASISENGVALAQACGEQATG